MIEAKLSHFSLFSYSLAALPLAFAGIPMYIQLPDFYAVHQGFSLGLLASLFLIIRMIDALQDPFIGKISDTLWQWRGFILCLAGLGMLLGLVALFRPPDEFKALWLVFFTILTTTCYSIFSINYNALAALWTNNDYQKTRITSQREFFGLVGLLLAVVFPTLLASYFNMPLPKAYRLITIILIVISGLCLPFFIGWYRQTKTVFQSFSMKLSKTAAKSKNVPQVKQAVFSAYFMRLKEIPKYVKIFFSMYSLSVFGSSIAAVLVLFFIRDRLQAEAFSGLFLAAYFLAAAAGMPVWLKLSANLGKHKAWAVSMLLAILSFFWALLLGPGHVWPFFIICIFSGLAFGADLSLPASILADHIQNSQQEHQASWYFSLIAFLLKSSLALSSMLSFFLLDMAGFQAGANNALPALLLLSLLYAGLPCVFKFLAILQLRLFLKQFPNCH